MCSSEFDYTIAKFWDLRHKWVDEPEMKGNVAGFLTEGENEKRHVASGAILVHERRIPSMPQRRIPSMPW